MTNQTNIHEQLSGTTPPVLSTPDWQRWPNQLPGICTSCCTVLDSTSCQIQSLGQKDCHWQIYTDPATALINLHVTFITGIPDHTSYSRSVLILMTVNKHRLWNRSTSSTTASSISHICVIVWLLSSCCTKCQSQKILLRPATATITKASTVYQISARVYK